MCGIAGLVDFGGRTSEELLASLMRMQAALRHRGPDGHGVLLLHGSTVATGLSSLQTSGARPASGPAVGFVHTRLAIIDLSPGGHQPMVSQSGNDWLTYNGELYNYRERREALERRGAMLRSTSDSEVIVESLARDGLAALPDLRGMFAFAWWSERDRRVTLVRDRFGIKPLFVARPRQDLVLFASEPRALAASGYLAIEPQDEGVAGFLARGSVPVGTSVWKGIDAVAPGGWISIDAARTERGSYWSLEDTLLRSTPRRSVAAVANAIRPALIESVEAHLVSDVPVGIFLSGGLDSTAVLAAAREVTSGPLQTFTVTMPGTPLDEAVQAREAARRFGSDHRELVIDKLDVDSALDEFFAAMQSPSLDGFNTFLVARSARQAGARVVLSGVGADELFGGYRSFVHMPRIYRTQAYLGSSGRLASRLLPMAGPRLAGKIRNYFSFEPRSVVDTWLRGRQLFTSDEIRALSGIEPAVPVVPSAGIAAFAQVRYCEFRYFLENQLLGDADAFTMCGALELRTPFVDHKLVEAAVAAGRWSRARGMSHKATLFAHLDGLHMPGSTTRRKQGFVLPFDSWIRDALSTPAPSRLSDLKARLSHPRYQPFVARFQQRRLHWSRIWALYVLDRMGLGAADAEHRPMAS